MDLSDQSIIIEDLSSKEANLLEWESKLGYRLPEAYRSLMLLVGNRETNFMQGTDYSFRENDDFELKYYANELIEELGQTRLSEDKFVFAMHQGYIFFYFSLTDGENPKVWIFSEIDKEHKEFSAKFTEFVKKQLA